MKIKVSVTRIEDRSLVVSPVIETEIMEHPKRVDFSDVGVIVHIERISDAEVTNSESDKIKS